MPEFNVGDFCTQECCITGVYAHNYAQKNMEQYLSLQTVYPDSRYADHVIFLSGEAGYLLKKAKVFCTDSISCEYSHLVEIKATGSQLIERETGAFYQLAELFEIPTIALPVASDSSANGQPLLGMDQDRHEQYHSTRSNVIPDMVIRLVKE